MRAAIIPTHGRESLEQAVDAIAPQVDEIILIAHNTTRPSQVWPDGEVQIIPYSEDPPNISHMWNLGLDRAEVLGANFAAILNDDAIVPPSWFDGIEFVMEMTGAVAGSRAGDPNFSALLTTPEPTQPIHRLSGHAFVLYVSKHIRMDDQFQWWYGDDDIDWQARRLGGTVLVPGEPVEHLYPNQSTTGILREIANEDRVRFEAKWGMHPWPVS